MDLYDARCVGCKGMGGGRSGLDRQAICGGGERSGRAKRCAGCVKQNEKERATTRKASFLRLSLHDCCSFFMAWSAFNLLPMLGALDTNPQAGSTHKHAGRQG